jgi:DNA-binding CsgD family transcriptional regulator
MVGRDRELTAVEQLLDGVVDGPAVLALWGEAGVGKTTVWEAGVAAAEARAYAVLACRAAAAEVRLSYAGLADLLGKVGADGFADLPPPQRRGLDAALLRGGDDQPAPEPRAVAAGFLTVLEVLAGTMPVLVAVDDLQWLDEPTRRVMAFAVRRCSGPVAVLTAGRIHGREGWRDDLRPRDPARLRHVDVGPLSLGALHHVLMRNMERSFPRPTLLRIAEVSGGNPFFALEIARSLDARGSGVAAFPDSLRAVVQDHIGSLEPQVREALLVASALANPRIDLVGQACGGVDPATLLGAGEDAGVVELAAGRVRFTHPLLATGVYSAASPTSRRALHRRLSDLVEDGEERARHLALAATGPEAEVVAALDAGAALARRRGAASAAAELLELALGLGADAPSRRVQAARDHFDADNPVRARQLLERAIADLGQGLERAEALGLLGTILYGVDEYVEAIEVLTQAFAEAGHDPRLRSSIAQELCVALTNAGRVSEALPYVETAIQEFEQHGDEGLLAEALGAWVIVSFVNGRGVDRAALARALALEDPDRRSHALRWPSLNAAMVYLWTHRLDEARAALAALRHRCLDRGEESDLWFVSYHAATAALWSGDLATAEQLTEDLTQRSLMVGTEQLRAFALMAQAQLGAWVGRSDQARAAGEEATALLARLGMASGSLFSASALGMVELSVGDFEAAARWLGPAAAAVLDMGYVEPACVRIHPDAVEAMVALGRLDEAEPLVEQLEVSGRGPDRTWAAAVGARCRGLLLAAEGHLDQAQAAFKRALDAHDRLPLRYERARTLLLLGQLQRRCNERQAAKATLEEAAGLFEAVGTARWADNARAELQRLGLHPGPPDQLTPTEERVAELAAAGSTNREVAAALFLSPKTIEANLSRVYRKLGIRSRAELGTWMAERRAEGGPPAT